MKQVFTKRTAGSSWELRVNAAKMVIVCPIDGSRSILDVRYAYMLHGFERTGQVSLDTADVHAIMVVQNGFEPVLFGGEK